MAQPADEVALVIEVFNRVQPYSISANREYCGYLGRDARGRIKSTRPTRGWRNACWPAWPDTLKVVASWHTHAGFDPHAWSETPSALDMEADEDEGIDGYVATPGGRVWHVDTGTMVARQVCGLRCVRSDPRFVSGSEGPVATYYTYDQLRAKEAE